MKGRPTTAAAAATTTTATIYANGYSNGSATLSGFCVNGIAANSSGNVTSIGYINTNGSYNATISNSNHTINNNIYNATRRPSPSPPTTASTTNMTTTSPTPTASTHSYANSNRKQKQYLNIVHLCRTDNWCAYAFISFVAIVCYLNGIHGDFVHDDIPAITQNKDVIAVNKITKTFLNDFWGTPMADTNSHKSYRPLTVLSFR